MLSQRTTLFATAFFLIGLFGCNSPARAANTLKEEFVKVAKNIQKTLEDEKQESIAIGDFTGPAQLDTNFGPAIQQALKEELEALKITVSKRAPISVKGEYSYEEKRESGDSKLKVNLVFRVNAANGKVKIEFPAEIKNNNEIAKILGLNISFPRNADPTVRNKEILDKVKNPTVHIDGSKVFASENGEYAAEILVKSTVNSPAATRNAKEIDGAAFVDIQRAEIYEIKLYNRSKIEAAVSVNIDGLDVFAFSEVKDAATGKPKYSHFIVPAGTAITVYGWHKTNAVADSFLVAEYGKGAASKGQIARGKVGVVTLTFRTSGDHPKDLPFNEREATNNETGFGPPVGTDLREVSRTIGTVRDIISIRYSR